MKIKKVTFTKDNAIEVMAKLLADVINNKLRGDKTITQIRSSYNYNSNLIIAIYYDYNLKDTTPSEDKKEKVIYTIPAKNGLIDADKMINIIKEGGEA